MKERELKKHVGTIHSHNKLTLVQRKIANALLYNAYEELLTHAEHQIHIKLLCQLIGYDSKDFKSIKKALIALISTVIEWNLIDKDRQSGEEGVWNASSIIADASIDGPICTYSYSNRMKQLLYRPELYGRINMEIQARFKSSYGLALYENCIRYQNISQTPFFQMPVFRKLMGVEDGKYSLFRDFKRRVLDKGVEEVNKHSPISITPHLKLRGRQVEAIQFSISNKIPQVVKLNSESTRMNNKSQIAECLQKDYGFSRIQANQMLTLHSEQYILEKIAIVESSSSFQTGKIVNLSQYLRRALEQDFQLPKSSKDKVRKKNKADIKIKLQKQHELEQFNHDQNQTILKQYQILSNDVKNKLIKEFANFIKESLYYNLYEKNGLENVLVSDKFCEFIRLYKKELLAAFLSSNANSSKETVNIN